MSLQMPELYGILGWPVAHSRSPAMHNAALGALQIDAVYVPFAVPPERLADAIAAVRTLGIRGLNLTLPHKRSVMPLLDEVEPDADAMGAVNTIVRTGERLVGANTDAEGFTRSLRQSGVELAGRTCVVLGAGGAARAAAVGLLKADAAQVTIAARRPERAAQMVQGLGSSPALAHAGTRLRPCGLGKELARLFPQTELLVQASSATLGETVEAQRFAGALPLERLPSAAVVHDLVYEPLQTKLLARAKELGLATVDGLGMLLHQGALALERWTGRSPPLEVMRAALR